MKYWWVVKYYPSKYDIRVNDKSVSYMLKYGVLHEVLAYLNSDVKVLDTWKLEEDLLKDR